MLQHTSNMFCNNLNLKDIFSFIFPDKSVEPVTFTPSLYAELDATFDQFRNRHLVSMHRFEEDWASWEKHPAGDELVILVSGSAVVVLELDSGEFYERLEKPGDYLVVPADTWHTARFSEPAELA